MDHEYLSGAVTFLDRVNDDDDNAPESMPPLDITASSSVSDVLNGAQTRYMGFDETWRKCEERIERIIDDAHTQVMDDLVDFLQSAYLPSEDIVLPHVEIPAAVVVGDTNLALHVFDVVQHRLRLNEDNIGIGSFVSTLVSSKDFSSSIVAMRSIINGLISQSPWEGLSSSPRRRANTTGLVNYDLSFLQAWYDAIPESSTSSGTRLVVFVPGVELCDPSVLREVIHICSLYVPHLPMVFVFSTGTSESIFQTMLPMKTRAKLATEAFHLQRGMNTFEVLIRGLFVDSDFDVGLALTLKSFGALKLSYTQHEQSVDAFRSTLHLLLYEHYSSPTSVFCNTDMLGEQPIAKKTLSHRSSAPFLAYMHEAMSQAAKDHPEAPASVHFSSSKSEKAVQTLIFMSEARSAFDEYHAGLKVSLRFFRRIALFVRTHAGDVRANWSALLEGALSGSLLEGQMRRVGERIESLPLAKLQALAQLIRDFCASMPEDLAHHTASIHEQSIAWLQTLSSLSATTNTQSAPAISSIAHLALAFPGGHQNPPEVVKAGKEISGALRMYFSDTLSPVEESVPIARVWMIAPQLDPLELLNPSIRHSLVHALGDPASLLPTSSSSSPPVVSKIHTNTRRSKKDIEEEQHDTTSFFDPGDLSTYPDATVLFRRYLDSGRTINAYDWFESLVQVMESSDASGIRHTKRGKAKQPGEGMDVDEEENEDDDDAGDDEERNKEWRKEMQARFLWTLHELDWNGLLRGTGRKRDHVARTLFDPPLAPLNEGDE